MIITRTCWDALLASGCHRKKKERKIKRRERQREETKQNKFSRSAFCIQSRLVRSTARLGSGDVNVKSEPHLIRTRLFASPGGARRGSEGLGGARRGWKGLEGARRGSKGFGGREGGGGREREKRAVKISQSAQ